MTELRNKLIDLGVDTLADLLLDLATHIDEVDAS